jgi:hypothetical protein
MYAKHFALQYHIFLILSSDLRHVGNALSCVTELFPFSHNPPPLSLSLGGEACQKNEKEKGKKERIKGKNKKDKRKRKRKKGNNGRLTPAKKKCKKKRKKERKEITKHQRKTSTYNLRLFT